MTISNEDLNEFNKDVVRLLEASTALNNEIVGQKKRFDEKLNTVTSLTAEAKGHETAANDYRNSAMNAEISANSHASRAEIAAMRAEEVAGLETVAEAVALAMDDEGLNIPTESDLNRMREQNKLKYKASGFVEFGLHPAESATSKVVSQGLYTAIDTADVLRMGCERSSASSDAKSKTSNAVVNVAGVLVDLVTNEDGAKGGIQFHFADAPDGRTTYNKSTGETIEHLTTADAFSLAESSDDIEVVISRIDMYGLNVWLEEITPQNPGVFRKGNVNSQDAEINGVPTVESSRHSTYFSLKGGKGKEVNWFTISKEDRIKVLADKGIGIYMINGKPCQWRVRPMTFAGLGNGAWADIDSTSTAAGGAGSLTFATGNVGTVSVQGHKDSVPSSGRENGRYIPTYQASISPYNGNLPCGHLKGVYVAANGTTNYDKPYVAGAVNGECYFLVCGVVQRLNQGAYHPVWNPLGTARVRIAGKGYYHWHMPDAIAFGVDSTFDCFGKDSGDGATVNSGTGAIGQTVSTPTRPDQYKFHDAIHAGLVIQDARLSCRKQNLTELRDNEVRKSVGGVVRGKGKVPFTNVFENTDSSSTLTLRVKCPAEYIPIIGEKVYVELADGTYFAGDIQWFDTSYDTATGTRQVNMLKAPPSAKKANGKVVLYTFLPAEFDSLPWVDIIGTPERIAAAHNSGRIGQWISL